MFQQLFRKYLSGGSFGQSGSSFAGGRQANNGSGPPFIIGSADNGLSVDPGTFHIVLGQAWFEAGDPGKIISNRSIPLNGFDVVFNHALDLSLRMLELDDNNNYVQLASFNTGTGGFSMIGGSQSAGSEQAFIISTDGLANSKIELQANTFNQFSRLQQDDSVGNTESLTLIGGGTDNKVLVEFNSDSFLDLDFGNTIYSIGDISTIPSNHASKLVINDATSTNVLQTTDGLGNKSELLLIGVGGSTVASMFTIDSGGTTIAAIDGSNGIWRAFSNKNNGDYIRMSDFNNRPIEAGTDDGLGGVFRYLLVDVAGQLFQLGDIDAATNGTALSINPTNTTINYGDIFGAGNNFVSLVGSVGSEQYSVTSAGAIKIMVDPVAHLYEFGEIASNKMLQLNFGGGNNFYKLGNLAAGGTSLFLDDNAHVSWLGDTTANGNAMMLRIDDTATTVLLGRFLGGNSTNFNINDATGIINLTAINGFQIGGNAAFVLRTNTTQTNQAGAAAGTLTNAPTAGNPSKWIAINDNGTVRKIPTWL